MIKRRAVGDPRNTLRRQAIPAERPRRTDCVRRISRPNAWTTRTNQYQMATCPEYLNLAQSPRDAARDNMENGRE
jgi:hypothetical protein